MKKIYFRPHERREAMGREGEGGGEEPDMAAAGTVNVLSLPSSHLAPGKPLDKTLKTAASSY